jgi:membrane-bound lytic murein transglycosylase D
VKRYLGMIGVFFLVSCASVPRQEGVEGASSVDVRALRSSLGELRAEVVRLREALDETRGRLDRLQRLNGMEHYRFPKSVELFGQAVPLESRELWERMDREFLILVNDVPQVLLWMKRANRYFPFAESQLKARGLPDDLKYVAIVESGLRPGAKSSAGAVGLWQFMGATGSQYQLRTTDWVDERQDPFKSTDAAISYLRNLYGLFRDWPLAVASYNAGEGRVRREMERQRVTNFYDLILPSETERYVFRIAAAKVILSNPRAYGFELELDELYTPHSVERLNAIVERGELDLMLLAQNCGMTYRTLRDLNPHIRSSSLPKGEYDIYVPAEKLLEFSSQIKACTH